MQGAEGGVVGGVVGGAVGGALGGSHRYQLRRLLLSAAMQPGCRTHLTRDGDQSKSERVEHGQAGHRRREKLQRREKTCGDEKCCGVKRSCGVKWSCGVERSCSMAHLAATRKQAVPASHRKASRPRNSNPRKERNRFFPWSIFGGGTLGGHPETNGLSPCASKIR